MPGHLETLLAFDRQYQRDQQQSPAFLHRRDRRYALDQGEGKEPDLSHWLSQLQVLGDTRTPSDIVAQIRFWKRLSAGFIATGTLLGLITMSGLLFYDGGQQINVTVILALVLLQLLLALYTAVQGLAGWQPWAPVLRGLQRRFWQQPPPSALTPLLGPMMTRAAQGAGLAFGVAGLVTLMVSVVLQDLAFGWSTTLDTSAGAWHRIVSWVAAPWSGWLPAATPSLELVNDTRFFRLDSDATDISAARWGAWWPFVAMTWLTWVVLPRLLLLGLASLDLRRKTRRAIVRHPGYPALLWRMETPAVDTGSETTDSGRMPEGHHSATVPVPETGLVVSWAGVAADGLPGLGARPLPRAGGNQSLEADHDTLTQLAARRSPADHQLLVLTRSWEPPTAELADFLEDAAEHLPGLALILLPVANDARQRPGDQQLGQWLRFAERAGSHIRVAAIAEPETDHETR